MTSTRAFTNWGGNLTYRASGLERPASLDALRRAVTSHAQVAALGTRHSFSAVADTGGTHISLDAMPARVEIDSARSVARVPAGLTYAQVSVALDGAGFALANLASLPHISVGGAVQTGTHGSGVRNSSLAAAVTGMEIVRADGETETVTASGRLDAHRVALGALGVVTSVDLAVQPRYEVAQWVHVGLPWDAAEEHFDAIMGAAYSVSMFTRFLPEGVLQVCTKRRTDEDGALVPLASLERLGARAADGPVHPVPGGDPLAVTEQGGVPGPWYERLPHFRSSFTPSAGAEIQCEYLLPAGRAVEAIEALRSVGDRLAPVLYTAEIRRVAGETAWLAPNHERDSVAFHFTFHRDAARVAEILPVLDGALSGFAARPHWGKVSAMSGERLRQVYPRLAEFASLAERVDPTGRFRTPFLREALGL
ncbi:FAD-binding protein [Streptomyces sp. NPDC091292]|uniref:FAD-binding protein n=1 Tax=Streptomyces sp. NPDC091292 TaxID=3365991 RepID=UPI003824F586